MSLPAEPTAGGAQAWLEEQLADHRQQMEEALERALPPVDEGDPSTALATGVPRPVLPGRAEAGPYGPATPLLDRLHQAMRYAVLNGGKRLRPVWVLAAAEACGGGRAQALPAAVAVELVHCYSLVHDDLPAMDDDDLRRGRPTCHKVFGDGVAILAGDALLTLAFEVLAQEIEDRTVAAHLVSELAQAAGHAGMVGGQVVDILSEGTASSTELLDYIHRKKTGALIRASVHMGALCAGASKAQLGALSAYGDRVGLAFQIADDILDVTSTPEELGKATEKDSGRSKLTYPGVAGLEAARHAADRLVEDAVNELTTFGERARLLKELARFAVSRAH
jgi:geranylgeranyl diphosphate synthase type II